MYTLVGAAVRGLHHLASAASTSRSAPTTTRRRHDRATSTSAVARLLVDGHRPAPSSSSSCSRRAPLAHSRAGHRGRAARRLDLDRRARRTTNATNPFPGAAAARSSPSAGSTAAACPTASASRRARTTACSTCRSPRARRPQDVTLQYEIADATNDPSRYVWGNVTISIEDRPGPGDQRLRDELRRPLSSPSTGTRATPTTRRSRATP